MLVLLQFDIFSFILVYPVEDYISITRVHEIGRSITCNDQINDNYVRVLKANLTYPPFTALFESHWTGHSRSCLIPMILSSTQHHFDRSDWVVNQKVQRCSLIESFVQPLWSYSSLRLSKYHLHVLIDLPFLNSVMKILGLVRSKTP